MAILRRTERAMIQAIRGVMLFDGRNSEKEVNGHVGHKEVFK